MRQSAMPNNVPAMSARFATLSDFAVTSARLFWSANVRCMGALVLEAATCRPHSFYQLKEMALGQT